MTRINVGVDPKELSDKALLAEHREITRIPNAVKTGKAKIRNLPEQFSLGTGHVRFFYDKLMYLKIRYHQLYKECKARGFNVTNKSESFQGLPRSLMNRYKATRRDRNIIIKRLKEKGHI